MKKNYLFGLAILFATGASAQVTKKVSKHIEKSFVTTEVGNKADGTITPKAGGDIVWQDDFSNLTNWTIDNAGQTGPTFGWNINATESSWWTNQVINSTSDGNFAEVNNGNPTLTPGTQALNVVYTLTTAQPIPITTNALTLSFLQYGAKFNDAQEIYISTDGTSWTLVGDNSDLPTLSAAGGAPYANPSEKSINLATLVPGTATQIWVRFSWTTGFPAQATNPNVWVAYGWMLDDVKIIETFGNDLKLNGIAWGVDNGFEILPYYKTPIAQVQPVNIGGIVENAGSLDKTDAVFNATVTSASFAGSSAASTILAYQSDTLFTTVNFTPTPAVGTFVINGFGVQSALDDIPSNNTSAETVNYEITAYTYARDKDNKTGTFSNTDAQGLPTQYELCNQFDVFTGTPASGVDFFVDQTTSTDAIVYVNIRDLNSAAFDVLEQSSDYIIQAGDKNKFITLQFATDYITTDATSYLVCVGSYGGVGTTDLVIGTSGESAVQTSFLYDQPVDTWFYTTSTPMVRLSFAPNTTSTIELSNEFIAATNVYPNPTSGLVNVDFTLNSSSDVSLEVIDVTGKVIYTNNAGVLANGSNSLSINANSFQAGVYYVNVLTNGTKVTRKLIKE
jgi:hypothetical protein